MGNRDTDVVVIGGGPAGLATAIAAAQRGLRSVVLDGARPPLDKTCGEGLMPDAVSALRNLGIPLGPVAAVPFRGIRLFENGAAVEAHFAEGCGFGIRRTHLHELLVRRARETGADLRWGVRAAGLIPNGVRTAAGSISCRWIVGADGQKSQARRWAGLDTFRCERQRFGYRQHFEIAPWSDMVEVYWGNTCQIVVTPVAHNIVCAAVVSHDPRMRIADGIQALPALANRLGGARPASTERGAVTSLRILRATVRGHCALVGDASGSVDAITGQGLCLGFRQAEALGEALASNDLSHYAAAHPRIAAKPVLMSRFMLALAGRPRLRQVVMAALVAHPPLFSTLLRFHTKVKAGSVRQPELAAGRLT